MLGQTIGANVIVKEGISEGDRIVVDGVQLLHDGSRVALDAKKTDAEKGNTGDSTANADRINDKSKKKIRNRCRVRYPLNDE